MNIFNFISSEASVGVAGDLILDEYIYGNISYEENIFKAENKFLFPGGAANVAANLHKLGCSAYLFSVSGTGANSKRLLNLLTEREIEISNIVKVSDAEISKKTRIKDKTKQFLRVDDDYRISPDKKTENLLYEKINKSIDKLDVMILSDYNKGCLSEDLFVKIKNLCISKNVKVFVDCSRKHDFRKVFLLKPNMKEFIKITGKKFENFDEMTLIAKKFKTSNGIINLLITLDKYGMILIDKNNKTEYFKSLCPAAADTCGAGDSLMAAAALCIAGDSDIHDAMKPANCAAAVCCSKEGTYAVSRSDIQKVYEDMF